jgi:hypothetical protein
MLRDPRVQDPQKTVNCYPTAKVRRCLTICSDFLGGRIYDPVDKKLKAVYFGVTAYHFDVLQGSHKHGLRLRYDGGKVRDTTLF